MGIYEGAEIWGLIGIYILTCLATIVKKSHCRFYKDDDLLILCNVNARRNIIKEVKSIGFNT